MRTPTIHVVRPSAQEEIPANPEPSKQALADRYERCSFCQSKLLFSHDICLNSFEVIETSRCTSCGVSKSPKRFTLQ